ncbi:DNA (cytosine-5-)-methyltransferase [Sodalinema gerasimenkoae]|uniref:DNA (cytosine-5-)-methyltransferase n=1 Tax=Sodalinema gerasimenkoae TaxID=2862348 RepID=UPI0013585891
MQQLNLFESEFVNLAPVPPSLPGATFTFVDLFAGIGGFRIALERLGGQCLGYSEIDAEAIAVYQKNFITPVGSSERNLGDVQKIGKLPESIDLIVGGVPCQPWSIAGKIKGFEDNRGKLWFDVIRIIEQNHPKAFIFENVKGLMEPRHRESLDSIVTELSQRGYEVTFQVLNSYDFGLPQDRDRIFIVGIQTTIKTYSKFRFPEPLGDKPRLYDCIEGVERRPIQKQKFPPEHLFGDRIPASRGRFQKIDELNNFFLFSDVRDGHTTIHSWDLIETSEREKEICLTLLRNRRKKKYGLKDGNPLRFEHLQKLIPDLAVEELEKLVEKKILRHVQSNTIFRDIGYTSDTEEGERLFAPTDIYGTTSEKCYNKYEFVNSKISAGINGVAKIILPHADAIGTLTATGMRDYVATCSLDHQDPNSYKQEFIEKIYKPRKFKPISAQDYARLQGFPDNFMMARREAIARKQFGNAVSVPVVYHLTRSLLNVLSAFGINPSFLVRERG